MDTIGFEKSISKDASTDDTLALIIKTAVTYSKGDFVKHVAENLCPHGTTRKQALRNIFEYYCRNVVYKLDAPNIEKVYTPNRIIIEGAGDCKKAATFLGAVLLACGIEPIFKHVYYDNNDMYTHIYIIVGTPYEYVTLDPTNNCQYDKEVKYKHANLYFTNGKKMELKLMGAHDNQDSQVANINYSSFAWDENIGAQMHSDIAAISENMLGANKPTIHPLSHGAVMSKLIPNKPHLQQSLKNIPVANQRGAFLKLIEANYNGLATNLAAALGKDPKALDAVWKEIGGDMLHLKSVVLSAASKKPTTGMQGPDYIGFSFKHLLHSCAGVLHAVASVVSIVYPPAGAVLNKVADVAEKIATDPRTPEIQIHDKHIDKLIPPDPTGQIIVNPNQEFAGVERMQRHHGSFVGHPVSFALKSLLLISTFHINQEFSALLGTAAIIAPLAYLFYKSKLSKWTSLKH